MLHGGACAPIWRRHLKALAGQTLTELHLDELDHVGDVTVVILPCSVQFRALRTTTLLRFTSGPVYHDDVTGLPALHFVFPGSQDDLKKSTVIGGERRALALVLHVDARRRAHLHVGALCL